MKELRGVVVSRAALKGETVARMFALMELFYTHMHEAVFLRDLGRKDFCLLLYDEGGELQGFSTQQLLRLQVGERIVHGVFSGDTIIHKAHWGSSEIFKVFARFFLPHGEAHAFFYWFLTSKGYKTYKILPTFFKRFYPNVREDTPQEVQRVIDAFGAALYPEEYEPESGRIVYRGVKDALRPGVADVTEQRLRDRDTAFFVSRNPTYLQGTDLACIAELKAANLKPAAWRLLRSAAGGQL